MRRGETWGSPATGPPDVVVAGGDPHIARVVSDHPGARVALAEPSASDIASAVGLTSAASPGETELALDAIDLGDGTVAVNVVVLGVPPDRLRRWHRRRALTVSVDDRPVFAGRASTVVVATGQYLRGADVVPRGHPGDGRIEVQVYALDPGQRAGMRRRLPGGTHVPHPAIVQVAGRRVDVAALRPWALEVDGCRAGRRAALRVGVRAGAWRLLV